MSSFEWYKRYHTNPHNSYEMNPKSFPKLLWNWDTRRRKDKTRKEKKRKEKKRKEKKRTEKMVLQANAVSLLRRQAFVLKWAGNCSSVPRNNRDRHSQNALGGAILSGPGETSHAVREPVTSACWIGFCLENLCEAISWWWLCMLFKK